MPRTCVYTVSCLVSGCIHSTSRTLDLLTFSFLHLEQARRTLLRPRNSGLSASQVICILGSDWTQVMTTRVCRSVRLRSTLITYNQDAIKDILSLDSSRSLVTFESFSKLVLQRQHVHQRSYPNDRQAATVSLKGRATATQMPR